nr:type I-E CRISPR-associated protein Cas7/Cse4/CasC [Limosilactobacillus fermentum]
MMKNLYLDINVLQTVPSSNINRDDTGTPKTAIYGGVTRSRVSSQSWKRVMRQAFMTDSEGAEWLNSHRTKHAAKLLAGRIKKLSDGLSDEEALEKALEAFNTTKFKPKKDKKTGEYLTGALLQLSNGQLDKLAHYVLSHDELDTKEIKETLMEKSSLDLALFGRMVADDPELNVDAASQVAHAISTHAIVPEYDFYTAIDDDKEDSQAGSAMMGTLAYNSSTLYRYANVNINELMHNLGSTELTIEGVKLFVKEFMLTMPTGKENTFANKTLPQYVMITLREDTPVNLVSAFEEPVKSNHGYVEESIERLEKEYSDTLKLVEQPIYTGVLTTKQSNLNQVANTEELLDQVAKFVSEKVVDDENVNG